MRIAVYPGSFDPVSNGYLDIIKRAANIFDEVYVLISINPQKKYVFTTEERKELLLEATKDLTNVNVDVYQGLVLEFAKSKAASVIIRGVRNILDYQNEITLFQFNYSIDKSIDTFVLFPSTNNLFLSSTGIKELVMFDKDISQFVPAHLSERITKIIKERCGHPRAK
ncbi:MAG: pantetheine-phosphate adenylyltransferase [Bacilli bacterium]|nr:pantetheine-phosphate adenylyltransferase [Bacilli bacterium]